MNYEMNKVFDEVEKALIYSPKGEIDISSSHEFQKEIISDYNVSKTDIFIDAKDLVYMDSTGLGSLIAIYKIVNEGGHKIVIENVRKFILKQEM